MPLSYWPLAFATAVFLINRLPTPVLSNTSPYQKLFGISPNYTKLRTFGCLCFPWLRPYAPNKLEHRSSPYVFVGYSLSQSAYHCLEPKIGRIFSSRHVRFNETQYPFTQLIKTPASVPHASVPSSSYPPFTTVPLPQSLIQSPTVSMDNRNSSSDSSPRMPQPSSADSAPTVFASAPTSSSAHSQPPEVETPEPTSMAQTEPAAPVPVPAEPVPAPPRHTMTTRSRNNIVKPVTRYNLTVSLQDDPHWIPSTWQHEIKHEGWRKAMSSEFNSTSENHTWDLTAVTETMNIVGCRWVLTIKYNPDGSIDKYKSRIVAKGFHQQQGIDYNDTFSPVIKATTIMIILGLAVNQDWPICQIDVNTDFLQGHLNEEVFMSQPPGFTDPDRPTHVCRLHKAIYGLKQAPRAWYSELTHISHLLWFLQLFVRHFTLYSQTSGKICVCSGIC